MTIKDLWLSHSHRVNADDSEKYMDEEDFKMAILEWESAKTVSRVELPVKPACETLNIIDEMLREADILKEHKDYVYNLDNAERLRGYKLALLRLKEKIMSKSV